MKSTGLLAAACMLATLWTGIALAGTEGTTDRTTLVVGSLDASNSTLLNNQFVGQSCKGSDSTKPRGAIPALLVSWFANIFVKGTLNHLHEKLKEYSTTYTTKPKWNDTSQVFFAGSDSAMYTCFVLTRAPCISGTKDDEQCLLDSSKAGLELVGQLKVTSTYTQVRPLAVRYVSTQAPAIKSAGVAVSVTATTLWSENGVGNSSTPIDSHVFYSDSLLVGPNKHQVTKLSGQSDHTRYFIDKESLDDWTKHPRHERLPLNQPDGSSLGLTISVAEVGTPPKHLKALKRFFEDNEEKLSPILANAIGKRIDIDMSDK